MGPVLSGGGGAGWVEEAPSRDVVSSGVCSGLIPRGAPKHELYFRAGSPWGQGADLPMPRAVSHCL